METQFSKVLFSHIALGIWILVLQNFGVFESAAVLPVRVVNTVDIEGYIGIDNTVDINISEINGHRDVFFNNYDSDPNKYYRLPIINQ